VSQSIVVEASILSADFARLGEQAREAEAAGAEAIQVDVMDGHFVPNITFGPGIIQAVRRQVSARLDAHLMISEPERYVAAFAEAGADCLIVHPESGPHIYRVLESIRELGIRAGVAINPGTPLSAIEEALELAEIVQVMTVNPGFGGQPFLSSQLDKIRRLRRMLDDRRLGTPIAVDGGIDTGTAPLVVRAGASVLVSGTSVFKGGGTVAENVAALRAAALAGT